MANLTVNVNTAVTHTEAITRMKDLNPNVSDSVTMLSEIVEVNPLTLNVFDSTTISESITLMFPLTPGYRALTTSATITQTTDDAFSTGGATINLYGVDVNLGISNGSQSMDGGFRFTGLGIPQGAIISAAKLTLDAENVQFSNQSAIHLIIYGEASGNTSTFNTTNGPDQKNLTSASVTWDITFQGSQATSDFTAVIQEIVNRSDWASGNAMTIIIKDNGNTVFGGAGNNVGIVSSEGDTGNGTGAKLSITWSSYLFDTVSTSEALGMRALPISVSDSVSTSESISNSVTFPSGILSIDANISIGQNKVNSLSTPTFSTQQANEVLIALVSTNTAAVAPTISGGGLTWVAVVSKTTQPIATVFSFRAFASSVLSNVQITVTAPDSSNYNFVLTVLSYVNADTSGTNGSGAIGTTGTNSSTNAQPSVTIVTARDGSRVVAAFGYNSAELLAANTGQLLLGFTEDIDTNLNAYSYGTSMQGANTSPAGSVKTDLTNAAGFFNGLAIEVMVNLVTNITVNDATTTSESITMIPTLGDIVVNDSTTASESVVVDLIPQVNIFDSAISITENVKVGTEDNLNVGDSVTTADLLTQILEINTIHIMEGFPANTVSYYKFDENTGSTVGDSAGSQPGAWAGTLGSQWTTGIIKSGGNFDFFNSTYVSGMNPAINANSFSISWWALTGTQAGTNGGINNGWQDFWALDSGGSNRMVLEIVGGDGSIPGSVFLYQQYGFAGMSQVQNATDIRNNGWHHFVIAASTSANLVTLYVDSVAVATGTWAVASTVTTNFIIGNRSTTDNRNITAVLDEVGVSSRPLTQAEVTALYNSGVGFTYDTELQTSDVITQSLLIDNININDAITTSEATTVDAIDLINVNDATATSESITPDLFAMPSVNDATTASESITITESALIVNVSDATTTSEAVTVEEDNFISVNDSSSTSESVVADLVYLISVNDTLATTLESLTVDVIDQEPIVETVTTSENLAILLINTISVNDATTTSESLTVLPSGQNIILSENINTSESVTMLETDFVTPSDSSTISESLILTESSLIITINDATTTSESVVMDEIDLISVNDSVTTSESVTLLLDSRVSVNDSTTASEAIVLDIIEQEIIFDSVTTSENVKVVMGADIAVNDAVTISESVTPLIPLYLINLFENQNVTDIRHNYVTNPSFEGDSVSADPPNTYTNFTSINSGILVRGVANDSALSGTQSWKITETGGAADAGMTSPKYAVTPGNYTVSTYMKTALTVGQAHLHVKVYSGANVTAEYDFTSISGTTGWTRYSLLIPVGLADTSIELWLGLGSFNDTFATGSVWYDAVQIEQGSNLDTYFDGSFSGAQWDGVVNLSASSTSVTVDTADIIDQEIPFDEVATSESVTVQTTEQPFAQESVSTVEDINITQQSATATSLSLRDELIVTEFVALVRNNTIDAPIISDNVTTSEDILIQRVTNISVSDRTIALEGFSNMLKFNGLDQYISLPFNANLHPTTGVTVEGWVYHANWAADTTPRDIYSNTSNGGFALRINDVAQTAPALCFTIRANNSYQTVSVSMLTFVPGWHFFVGTFDGRFLKIYSDTVLKNTVDLGAIFAIQYSNANGSIIGANADENDPAVASGNYWSEQIGMVRVYKKAMSQAEIANHYNQTYPDESTVALVYYFPEGQGTTTLDTSPNNITGTIINAPIWQPNTMPQAGLVLNDQNVNIVENTIVTSESLTTRSILTILPLENVTVSEDVTVYVPVYNTNEPEDDVAISENTTLLVEEELVLEDDITTSENVAILIDKNISVSDSSTVTQNSAFTVVYGILVSETVITSESLATYSDENPIVNETATITEDVQFSGDLFVTVNDSTTITEDIQEETSNRIFMLENVSVIESVILLRTGFGSVVEDVLPSEDIALDLISFVSVEDDVATIEDLVIELREVISIANTTVTSENLAIQLDILISAGESVATDDVLTIELDNFVFITEVTTPTDIAVADIPLSLAVSDFTTITESLTLRSDDLDVVFDAVATAETVTLQVPEIFLVEDDVTISESVTLNAIELFSVNDILTTSELVIVTRVSASIVSDSTITNESVTIRLHNNLFLLESTTLTENIVFGFDTLDIIIQELVTVVDTVIAGRIEISIFDTVTVLEYSNTQYPREIDVEEDVVVHDRLVHVRTPDAPPPVLQANTATENPVQVYFAYVDDGSNI